MNDLCSKLDACEPRPIYAADHLRPLVAAKSAVIVGASQRPNSFGSRALANAIKCKLPGLLGSVNPNYDELQGKPCWRSIADMPETVDCAVIAVPAALVVETVREILQLGKARSVIIFSSGLGEAGEEGAQAEAELTALASNYGVPICGPNTIGLLNFADRTALTFLVDLDLDAAPSGGLAVVSQSAGIGVALSHARQTGARLSHVLLAGNSCDVNVLDFCAYLLAAPNVRAIAVALEGLDHPRGLLDLGAAARRAGKTIVALKTGRSSSAAEVVQSHTGSLIGTYELYEATFERAGIVAVETIEELFEVANCFAKAPRASSMGIGVLTNSGGAAVMAADHADEFDVPLPRPASSTIDALKEITPGFAAITNPADLTASMALDWSILTRAILTFANDPAYAAVVVPIPAPDLSSTFMARPNAIIDAARQSPVPICVVWMSAWRDGPGIDVLEAEPNILVFRSMKRCMQALAGWMAATRSREEDETELAELSDDIKASVSALIDAASANSSGSFVLDEVQSRQILDLIGIASAEGGVANDSKAATDIAAKIGYPVVVKALVDELAHKSDVGAVKLNLSDGEAVELACRQIQESLGAHGLLDKFQGFLVCKMVSGGFEGIVGGTRDPLFGPTVAYGAGGTAVEQLNDVVMRLSPSSPAEIRKEIENLKAWNVLSGGRGAKARDVDAFVAAATAVAALIAAEPRIGEIDVNPLLIRNAGDGVVALDALITIRSRDAE